MDPLALGTVETCFLGVKGWRCSKSAVIVVNKATSADAKTGKANSFAINNVSLTASVFFVSSVFFASPAFSSLTAYSKVSTRVTLSLVFFKVWKSAMISFLCSSGEPSNRSFNAVPSPKNSSFPHSLHFSHPTQSMIEEIFRKCRRNSSFRSGSPWNISVSSKVFKHPGLNEGCSHSSCKIIAVSASFVASPVEYSNSANVSTDLATARVSSASRK
mmetsp:Transcript_12681/g.18343  ORF Transcript_12681/g.18343 Transcript_12681/m.18343 type:complete len:216 (+) Transcript_12681:448-1095(+)